MRKFKDFIHSSNDILLAILIVALAVGFIIWRLKVILNYENINTYDNSKDITEEK